MYPFGAGKTPLACTDPFDALRVATEYIGTELHQRAIWRDIWLNVIPKKTYPKHVGKTLSTFVIERNEPAADVETWVGIDLVGSSDSNACAVTWNDTDVGHTETTFSPEQFGLRGPILCKDELIFSHNPEQFWESYMSGLTKRSRRSISNRLLYLYYINAHKSVARADYQRYAQTTLTLPESTCELTQEMLDQTAIELMEDGATDPDSNGWITLGDQGPLFPLYIGLEASQKLVKNNAEFRQDIRDAWSTMTQGSLLMLRLGATLALKNFRHIINLFPPRFTYAGGAYTRVNTFTRSAATKGFKYTISNAYRAATHEMAIVLHPLVIHEHVIEPQNSVAGMTWDPTNYFGEWQWVTGGREIMDDGTCYDPTKKYGRHFAEYKHAVEPIFPEYGRAIIFKRCPATGYECIICS